MSKIIELKGKDIIKAYDGNNLSDNFGYSCANFNCEYQEKIDLNLFDIYVDNTNNISCFVYINDNGKIEGRRMFFKGKQLLDDKVFPIITKLNSEIYYLYGYYGNDIYNRNIVKHIVSLYSNDVIYLDNGYFNKGLYYGNKEYWIMEINNMEYDEFPPIDFLFASYELTAFSNFKPHQNIIKWLKDYYKLDDINFRMAYHFKPKHNEDDFIKHWNQKYYYDKEIDEIEIEDEEDDEYFDDFDE